MGGDNKLTTTECTELGTKLCNSNARHQYTSCESQAFLLYIVIAVVDVVVGVPCVSSRFNLERKFANTTVVRSFILLHTQHNIPRRFEKCKSNICLWQHDAE